MVLIRRTLLLQLLLLFLVFIVKKTEARPDTLLTLRQENVRLERILNHIENKTGYSFFFITDQVPLNKVVSIDARNEGIHRLMRNLFRNTNIDFRILDSQIVLTLDRPPPVQTIKTNGHDILPSAPSGHYASRLRHLGLRKYRISGTVTDRATGEPLPGVNIIENNTHKGTVTDMDGHYSLKLDKRTTEISFSYIGYANKTVTTNGSSVIDIQMISYPRPLQEVVLIGYGNQKHDDLTGSISTLHKNRISKLQVSGIDQAIQGLISGVYVVRSSGRPGAPVSIKVRGIGTVNNSEPLIVIDGFPVANENLAGTPDNALDAINPNDIEKVTVLKDASATSIYGARGANGVIMIETKRGRPGSASVSFSTYRGIANLSGKIDLLDTKGYVAFYDSLYTYGTADGIPKPLHPAYSDPANLATNTDWQEVATRTADVRNYYFSVSGGTESGNFNSSAGYYREEGILHGTNLERYSMRINSDFSVGEKFRFGESVTLSRLVQDREARGFNSIFYASPMMPVYDPINYRGYAGPSPLTTGQNTVTNVLAENLMHTLQRNTTRIMGTLYADYEIIRNFRYRLNGSIDLSLIDGNTFIPRYDLGSKGSIGIRGNLEAYSYQNKQLRQIWLVENILHYKKQFFDNHELSLMAGQTIQAYTSESLRASARNFPDPRLTLISSDREDIDAEETFSEWRLLSYLFRIRYALQKKYYLTTSMRIDGSSRFGPKNRWGHFPSFAAAWKVSNEQFWPSLPFVEALKIRIGYGLSGNQEIGNYGYYTQIATDRSFYVFGLTQDTYFGGSPLLSYGNRNIRWENATQGNAGIDIRLFRNKLAITSDYYLKRTNDMLVRIPLSGLAGMLQKYAEPYVNVGIVDNRGLEFSASYKKFSGRFHYALSGNLSTINNRVVYLEDNYILGGDHEETRTEAGYPVGSFYGYVHEGIFRNQEEIGRHAFQSDQTKPGDIKFKDLDRDGYITPMDRTHIGKPVPDLIYGFTMEAFYANFDLSLYLQGVQGNDIYSDVMRNLKSPSNITNRIDHNKSPAVLNYWSDENKNTDVPRLSVDDPNNNARISDRWIEDGSFMRIRCIQVGYNLPLPALTAIRAQKARIYVSGQNLFTFTGYSGLEPEIGSEHPVGYGGEPTLDNGIDYGVYPQPRIFSVGLQLTF